MKGMVYFYRIYNMVNGQRSQQFPLGWSNIYTLYLCLLHIKKIDSLMDYYKALCNKYTSHWDPWKQREPCLPSLLSSPPLCQILPESKWKGSRTGGCAVVLWWRLIIVRGFGLESMSVDCLVGYLGQVSWLLEASVPEAQYRAWQQCHLRFISTTKMKCGTHVF